MCSSKDQFFIIFFIISDRLYEMRWINQKFYYIRWFDSRQNVGLDEVQCIKHQQWFTQQCSTHTKTWFLIEFFCKKNFFRSVQSLSGWCEPYRMWLQLKNYEHQIARCIQGNDEYKLCVACFCYRSTTQHSQPTTL